MTAAIPAALLATSCQRWSPPVRVPSSPPPGNLAVLPSLSAPSRGNQFRGSPHSVLPHLHGSFPALLLLPALSAPKRTLFSSLFLHIDPSTNRVTQRQLPQTDPPLCSLASSSFLFIVCILCTSERHVLLSLLLCLATSLICFLSLSTPVSCASPVSAQKASPVGGVCEPR